MSKAKSKKAPKQRSQKAKPKAKVKATGQTHGTFNKLANMVCSNSNPFCPEANGAKLYDENSSRSLTYQDRFVINITTDANGQAFYAIGVGARTCYNVATITAGSVSAWGGWAAGSFYSSLSAAAGSYRAVSAGFHFRTTQAWSTATGSLIITEHVDDPTSVTGFTVGNMRLGPTAELFPVRDADVYFVSKPQGMSATTYTDIASTTILPFTLGTIAVTGATASTQIGAIEVIVNYEWMPIINTAYTLLSTPAAPVNPTVMQARSLVLANTAPIARMTPNHDRNWMSSAMGVLRRVLPMGIGMAFGPQAGMLANAAVGASTPMIMDAD
jgi:hypothetical protein